MAFRTTFGPELLGAFFQGLGRSFAARFNALVVELPDDVVVGGIVVDVPWVVVVLVPD